jgi:enoyl-CoA hydratase/carnithine racemase
MSDDIFRPCEEIELTAKGDYAVLRIARESKRNAMNRSTRDGMTAAFEHATDRFRAIVLTGSGKSFCAGIDLKERGEDVERGIHTASQEWAEVNLAIRQHPAVFIAAVNGTALGGGLTLINMCDLAIAADDVELGMPELGFGSYAGLSGPSTQVTITRKRAAWMVLTTDRIPAKVALEWGLVNQCVPAAELMPAAEALAARVAKFEPNAIAVSKRALDTIPSTITDLRQGFVYGELANASIRVRTGVINPFKSLPQSTSRGGGN